MRRGLGYFFHSFWISILKSIQYSKLFVNSELEGVRNFENLSKILEFKFTFGHVFPEKDVNWIPRGDTLIQHRYPK